MVNMTLAKGHHAETQRTARIFLIFHTVAVHPINKLYMYIIICDWGRRYGQVWFLAIQLLYGIKIPGIHLQVRINNNEQNNRTVIKCRNSWTKESNSEESNHWKTEWMNYHHRMEQYTINVQYTIIRDFTTNVAQGDYKGTNCMKSRGRLLGLSPFR